MFMRETASKSGESLLRGLNMYRICTEMQAPSPALSRVQVYTGNAAKC